MPVLAELLPSQKWYAPDIKPMRNINCKHCKLQFGTYIQASATQQLILPQTTGAIGLGMTESIQGSYYFLNKYSGKPSFRYNLTILTMHAKS